MIKGQCHCGKVKFSINCELKELRRCNCSHCRRKGYVMTTVNKDEFHLESGEDYLSIYQWNTKIAKHFFCCLLYTSPSPRDMRRSRMPSSA